MWESLQKILNLNPQTKVFVCHDYKAGGKRDEFIWQTTIAQQKENVQLANSSKEKYLQFRKERDATLGLPKLIHPSLQFNLLAGRPPKFVKTPISAAWYKGE